MMIAQMLMLITIALMISGFTPLYMTAIIGSTLTAVVAGIPLSGAADVTVQALIINALNPVIADMTGVLMFIGIMDYTGFLDVIVREVIKIGRKIGGGAGVAAGGGIAAGAIGALTGFTQPAITATITGPAATKLGADPNEVAGIQAHAGHFGNYAGFTHPTQVAVIATAGIGFGMINVVGAIVSLSIFAISYYRIKKNQKARGTTLSEAEINEIMAEFEDDSGGTSIGKAMLPFLILLVGFILGLPVFIVGTTAAIGAVLLSDVGISEGESEMLKGVEKIATPLTATIAFMFMSGVINEIGIVSALSDQLAPILSVAPIQVMLIVSAVTGLITQSNGASAAIVIPFLSIVLESGASPLGAAIAAAGGAAIMQYFLTGGPVAALSTVIPVVPGSDLKGANRFQRPSILGGLLVLFLITFIF